MRNSMCVCGQGRAGIWRMEVKKVKPPPSPTPTPPSPLKVGIGIGIGIELKGIRVFRVGASMLDSSSSSSSSSDKFAKRIEQAWFISQQPTPIACSSCTNGHIECKWCAGTGFFIIGDNMLCEVPSRNTTCVICGGEGSTQCSDCQGTGFRAKWLGKPQVNEE